MLETLPTRVVIVGGGIAGLAAAYRLNRAAPGIAVTLIESGSRLGGKIVTERMGGFVVEGGPDSFLSYKPRGIGLCRELGLADRLQGTNEQAHRSFVMRGGNLYELPEGLTGLIPSRFGPMLRTGLISPLGKLRMGLDYFLPPRSQDGDEALATFVTRRLGREVYERLVEPLLGGIYAGDGEQLSLMATFPQLRRAELEHGGLIKGVLAAMRSPTQRHPDFGQTVDSSGSNSSPTKGSAFVTLRAGLGEMVETLEARSGGVEVWLGTRVVRVCKGSKETPPDGGYTLTLESGERLHAAALLLATPAYVTADLVADLDPGMADTLRNIPYSSTATVSVAYPLADIPRRLGGYGYIVPRAEGRAVLACTWTSSKFPHRAPEGFALIRAFIGRTGQEGVLDWTGENLLGLVRSELRDILGISAPPIFHRIFRWPRSMPQYTLGHLDRLAVIEERLAAHSGLFVAGSAYRGIGIPDCIQSGEVAAERILSLLRMSFENRT